LVNHDPQGADQLVEVDYTTAVTWTADEQRLFAFERHEPAALAFACLLGGALLYATVVNLAALNRARINRRSARREG
jgi:hypothetical protein